jgi:hypothetical protein
MTGSLALFLCCHTYVFMEPVPLLPDIALPTEGIVLLNSVLAEQTGIKVLLLSGKITQRVSSPPVFTNSFTGIDNAIGSNVTELTKTLVNCTALETLTLAGMLTLMPVGW